MTQSKYRGAQGPGLFFSFSHTLVAALAQDGSAMVDSPAAIDPVPYAIFRSRPVDPRV